MIFETGTPTYLRSGFAGFQSGWDVVTQQSIVFAAGTGPIVESADVVAGSGQTGEGGLFLFDTDVIGPGDSIWLTKPVYVPRNALALYPFRQVTPTAGGGSGTILEPSDTLSGVGVGSNTGVGAATESPDVASGSGSGALTGAGAAQEAADTVAGVGMVPNIGLGAMAEGADVAAGAGAAAFTGPLISDPAFIVYLSARAFVVGGH